MRDEVTLPPAPESVRVARGFVSRALSTAGLDDLEFSAVLLVSELVTNAVLHARTEIALTVEDRAGAVRITVHDASPRSVQRRRHSVESGTGRGLMLVESVSRRWGIDPTGDGKDVWFELDAEPDAAAAEPDLDAFLALDDLMEQA